MTDEAALDIRKPRRILERDPRAQLALSFLEEWAALTLPESGIGPWSSAEHLVWLGRVLRLVSMQHK